MNRRELLEIAGFSKQYIDYYLSEPDLDLEMDYSQTPFDESNELIELKDDKPSNFLFVGRQTEYATNFEFKKIY